MTNPHLIHCKSLFTLLSTILLLSSCNRNTPTITVVCEENYVGNSIVKWEIMPEIQGNVKAYASTNPDYITEQSAVAMAPISDSRMTIVTPDPTRRYYYTLVFNEKYRVKIATRNIIIPGLQNFRDLGGYASNPGHKQVRWGKLYRSAAIDSLPSWSLSELKNIGIRTIIDLRTPDETPAPSLLEKHFRVVHVPVTVGCTRHLIKKIEKQEISNDSVCKDMEKMYNEIVSECQPAFKQIFETLLDESNYPIVMHSATGKGRLGVVAALILAALQVDEADIMADYELSNTYFDIRNASKVAYNLPAASQEAITSVYAARVNYLDTSLRTIKEKYGDIPAYLRKGIGLSKDDIKKLQKLLLEKQ